MLPVAIHLQSIIIQRQREIYFDHYWSIMMEDLVNLDEEMLVSLDVLIIKKERVAKAYNKKVKSKVFSVGDYAWKVILPMAQRDKALKKWSPN